MAKTTDYSGYRCKAGEVLDLRNQTVELTAPIRAAKGCTIKRGKFLGPKLPQHKPAVEIPHGADDVTVDRCSFLGGSYNGLVVALGERARIISNVVLEGSGWFAKLLEADGALIDGNTTHNLRRGGIYIGDDDKANDDYTDNVTIRDNWLSISPTQDEESPFRLNNARNVLVERNIFVGCGSNSKKESAQFRGGSGVCRSNVYIGSIATGQTPNGRPITAEFRFEDETIYGYVLSQAGSVVRFDRGSLSLEKSFTYAGERYTLKNGGGGYAFTGKYAANGLPAAKMLAVGVKIKGAKHVKGGTAVVT